MVIKTRSLKISRFAFYDIMLQYKATCLSSIEALTEIKTYRLE